MKYIDDINLFKSNKDFVAEIDMTGSLGDVYKRQPTILLSIQDDNNWYATP